MGVYGKPKNVQPGDWLGPTGSSKVVAPRNKPKGKPKSVGGTAK